MADEPHADLVRLLQRLEAIEQRMNRLEDVLERRQILPRPRSQRGEPAPHPHAPPEARVRPEEVEEPITVLPADQPEKVRARKAAKAPPGGHRPWQSSTVAWLPPRGDLEQIIGLKWAGWIGAIVLAIGVGLGIKFAYERGWLGNIPVEIRLALMSLVGFALLAAGEIVYRRVNVLSAAALFGAGVAVLFLVSYAGNTYYGAYPYSTAFVFALLTTLIGSAVAIRGRLVSIAVLSQLGGQLGPLVLSMGQPPGIALLGYVLMLQIVALILALWGRSPKWWVLRALSLAGTAWWVVVALMEGHWGRGLGHEVLGLRVVRGGLSGRVGALLPPGR